MEKTTGWGILGWIQDGIKKWGSLYRFLVAWFGPVYGKAGQKAGRSFCTCFEPDWMVINLGCGPYSCKEWPAALNVDLFPFPVVDVVADAATLPFKSNSVDAVICLALFEHIPDPKTAVSEIERVLHEEGECLCYLPFLVPYHAAPSDFYRWTINGASRLFHDFKEVTVTVGAGPTSALLWTLQEWLALTVSFGCKPVHDIIFLILMVITWPIKFIDFFLEKVPLSSQAASGFVVRAVKGDR